MNVYLGPNQSLMKNAYIGEVLHISSDLRGATLAGLKAQGWDDISSASGYSLDSTGLHPTQTQSNNNVFLYKYIQGLSSSHIITLHITGYATRDWSANDYVYNSKLICLMSDSSMATDTYIFNSSLFGAYNASGSGAGTKTGIQYRDSNGNVTAIGTYGTGGVAGDVDITTKINLSTGLIEYKLTSPQTHTTSGTLSSSQLTNLLTYKYIGACLGPSDKANNPKIYTVELTIEK